MSIVFVGTVSLASPASAAVPDRINFQGILETDGALFTGNADLSFAIYADSSGGTPVWSRAARTTEVRDGLYSVPLGPFAGGFIHDPAWLEVSVNGVPLQPRYRLESVPFALRAAEADRVAENAVDGASVRHGSLTAAHLSTDIVSTINGISNDGGNIDLVAGTNVAITPNNTDKTITINARIDGAITRVEAGGGLVGSDPTTPTVTLRVGAGTGIAVAEDAVSVDAAAIAGEGLRAVAPAQLGVQAGDGLQIAGGSLELAPSYLSGSAFDNRFVNEGQAGAVTTAMIIPDVVSSLSGVTNDGGNIELAAGHGMTIAPSDATNSITFTVDTEAFAGPGLIADANHRLRINPSVGLVVSSWGGLQLNQEYRDGSAYDDRFVNEEGPGTIPVGGIIMWSGAIGSIPAGWALCDGTTVNEHVTPDLRGRFVLPAGSGAGLTPRTVGQTGGTETHTLTTNEMPTHDHEVTDAGHGHAITDAGHGHAITDAGHTHTVTDPGHSHEVKDSSNSVAGQPAATGTFLPSIGGFATESATTSITINSAGTGISINSNTTGITIDSAGTGISINNNGSGNAHNNMPPYYVLAYIMRVQ